MNIIVKVAKNPIINKKLGHNIQAIRAITFKELKSKYNDSIDAVLLEDLNFDEEQIEYLRKISSGCMVRVLIDESRKDSVKNISLATSKGFELIDYQFILEELGIKDIGTKEEDISKPQESQENQSINASSVVTDIKTRNDMDMVYRDIIKEVTDKKELKLNTTELVKELEDKLNEALKSKSNSDINSAKEIGRLTAKIAELEYSINDAADSKLVDKRINQLQAELEVAEKEKKQLETEINKLSQSNTEVSLLITQLNDIGVELNNVKSEKSEIQIERDRQKEILKEILDVVFDGQSGDVDILDISTVITQLKNKTDNEIKELNKTVTELQKDIQETNKEHEDEIKSHLENIDRLENSLSGITKSLEEQKELYSELSEKYSASKEKDEKDSKEIERLTNECKKLKEESVSMVSSLKEKEEQIELLKNADKDAADKSREISKHIADSRILRDIINKIVEIKIPELMGDLSRVSEENINLQVQSSKLRGEISDLQLQIGKNEELLRESKNNEELYKSQLDELRNGNSTSGQTDTEILNKLNEEKQNRQKLESALLEKEKQINEENMARQNNEIKYKKELAELADRVAEKNTELLEMQNTLLKANNDIISKDVELNRLKRDAEEDKEASIQFRELTMKNIIGEYKGKANIYAVMGSGSFGITSIAMSIMDKLRKTKVVYLDLDLANPKADSWFGINPVINGLNEIKSDSIRTGIGALMEVGVRYAIDNLDKILLQSDAMPNNSRYISGVYSRMSDKKVLDSNLGAFLNHLGNMFDNIVIDCGKIGSSLSSDSIIQSVFSVAKNKVIVTTNDPMDVRNTLVKINTAQVNSSNTVWVLNVATSSEVNNKVRGMVGEYKVVQIPIHPQYYGKKACLDTVTILKPKITEIMSFMQE